MPEPFQAFADTPTELPPSFLEGFIRPKLEALAVEVVTAIREQVPELSGMLDDEGTAYALKGFTDFFDEFIDGRFVSLPPVQGTARQTHRAFVTRAFLQGHTLTGLLAAYQVGARIVWGRLSLAGREAGVAPDELYVLARILFDRLEDVSTASVKIFEQLRNEPANLFKERRLHLAKVLVKEAAHDGHTLRDLAAEASWHLPEQVACVALGDRFSHETHRPIGLDQDVLCDFERADPFMLVPSPDLPGRTAMLRRAFNGIVHALGPVVPLAEATLSLRLARRALTLVDGGLLTAEGGAVRCDDHLATLHLFGDEACATLLMDRSLAAFDGISASRRTPLLETLLTWLNSGSSLPEIAERLQIHPQTVRYRMRQLESLFDTDLNDPRWRIDMQLALRTWALYRVRAQHPQPEP
ncbi:helix-turn-helix domain-containing protein [Actinocorallia longicatena]|uniref:Helix-turn-helix domain-containing protein n=1 Tax=Actinocorallia longicatena TaxID=111803 RepID=A0ABP6QGQ1_9ACTN